MPRPDSKILQTSIGDTAGATDAPVKPSRLRATPANRKLANVVPLTAPEPEAANDTTAKVVSKSQAKRVAAMTALSPAQIKERKKALVESLKIAGGPLKEAKDLHKAAASDVAYAMSELAKLTKEHDKKIKALTKTREAYAALVKKRAEAFEKGKAKVEAEIAKLGQ